MCVIDGKLDLAAANGGPALDAPEPSPVSLDGQNGVIRIVGFGGLMAIDLGCRGAVVGLSLLIAGVLLRDRGDSVAARLGAALVIAAAASAISEAPGFPRPWQTWSLVLLALSCAGTVVFWLWARATFDDDFVLRPWHGALLAVIVGMQLFTAGWSAAWPALAQPIERVLPFVYLGLALLAAAQTLTTWRGDLVTRRLRLRPFVLIGTSAYIAAGVIENLWPGSMASDSMASGSSVWSAANGFGLFLLMGLAGWSVFQAAEPQQASVLLPAAGKIPGDVSATAPEGENRPTAIEPELSRRLQRLMTFERAYRREGLTIGSLSAELGVPEYRLRQLINEGLGHRNFNAFLNGYRIEEAKAALADPGQEQVPVLTIAMDTGFQSIGPFNRTFKAATDLTPTEFRRLALAKNTRQPAQAG
jgi:AraC-like DNA-binding protein